MAERPSVKEILARVRAAGPARTEVDSTAEGDGAAAVAEPSDVETTSLAPESEVDAGVAVASAPPPPTPESLGRPLTLKEKLAAARNRPASAVTTPSAPAAGPKPVRAQGDSEEVKAQATPVTAPARVVAAAPLSPEALGRPLTLKEKLAAARNRPAGAAGTAAAPARAEAQVATEPEAPAAVPAPPVPAPSPTVPQLTPEALGRPLTLKEKLAAARSGGAVAAAASAAPPKAKTAAKPVMAAAPAPAARAAPTRVLPPLDQTSDPRDLAEYLRRIGVEKDKKAKADLAAKAAAPASAPARPAPKRVESKVVPPRPARQPAGAAATAAATGQEPSRRALLGVGFWIVAGWGTFTAGLSAMTLMTLRFFFPNVLAEPPSTIKVGFPGDFEKNQVNERWKSEWGFWVVRSDAYDGEDKIYALSSICTHLGCPPNWLASEQKFKCPCHGSGFYISGVNFEGPAPRPLERYKVAMGEDGQILVDKSRKFQEEQGQWTDPESFIKV